MPVALEMILLFLLLGSVGANNLTEVSLISPPLHTGNTTNSLSSVSGTLTFNSTNKFPKMSDNPGHQTFPPSSTSYIASVVSSPETSTASRGSPVSELTISQEDSTKNSTMPMKIPDAPSIPGVSVMKSTGFPTTFGETSRPPVTMATSSLETSSGTREPLVTTATSSLKTISMTSGSPVITKTSSPKTSKGTSRLLVTMPATSLKTPMGTSGSTGHGVTTSSPNTSTNTSRRDKLIPAQGTKGTLLVAVLVALLVVIVLVALILLWLRRQKRKTGVLTLSRSGKRNGVADAWAGVPRVSEEEAMRATEEASGGNNDCDGPLREGSGQRPTLTTFFGRRKSHQGSMALEELKAGPASSLKGEEEPLVGNEDEGAEAPTSNGPEAREAKTP
uniref:Leukosialin n=1 Tax=Moschus moschiferus TaxID=68415 RepID=A0A8C6DL87_MOSMO